MRIRSISQNYSSNKKIMLLQNIVSLQRNKVLEQFNAKKEHKMKKYFKEKPITGIPLPKSWPISLAQFIQTSFLKHISKQIRQASIITFSSLVYSKQGESPDDLDVLPLKVHRFILNHLELKNNPKLHQFIRIFKQLSKHFFPWILAKTIKNVTNIKQYIQQVELFNKMNKLPKIKLKPL